jgi:hypothetical protein
MVVDEFTGGVSVEYVGDAGGGEGEGLCLLVDRDRGRCGKLRGSAFAEVRRGGGTCLGLT